MKHWCTSIFGLLLTLTLVPVVHAYPLDGYGDTGIRRLEASRLGHEGVIKGPKQPNGALLDTEQVDLRLLDHRDMELPPADPEFTKQIRRLLGGNADRYGFLSGSQMSRRAHLLLAVTRGDRFLSRADTQHILMHSEQLFCRHRSLSALRQSHFLAN